MFEGVSFTMNSVSPNLPSGSISPPSLSSILHFAWGMTMNLSHQDQQRYLAETFKTRFVALWDQCKDKNDIEFLNDVAFILSAYERSYGFERDVYFTRLDNWASLKQDKIDYYNDLANINSVNSDSIYSRLLAFLGSGSIAGTVTNVFKNNSLLLDSATLPFFLVGGAIGFGVFTFILRRYAHRKIFSSDEQITKLMNDFWQMTLRPYLAKIMYNLANDLMEAHSRYYKTRNDGSLPEEDEKLKKMISDMIPTEDAYYYKYHKRRHK